jgi:hypothetical protein
MTEEIQQTEGIKQFDSWLSTAQTGDKYTYFTGNLAHATCLADGYPLKQLKKHIMDKCCRWDLEELSKKSTDNKILFKSEIRLVQKGKKKYWDERAKDVLNGAEYIAVKL